MRVPNREHLSRPWRVHEVVTQEFRLEDVWELSAPGGQDDLPRLAELIAGFDLSQSSSPAVRMLVAVRLKLGELLDLDRPASGVGARVPSLRDRLPADLRAASPGPSFDALPFRSLYLLDDEWAAESANRTVHAVLHFGLIADAYGGSRGQLAVYVKPNGLLGEAYMAAIKPFRHLIVYPTLMRELEREWRGTPARR